MPNAAFIHYHTLFLYKSYILLKSVWINRKKKIIGNQIN